MKTVRTKYLDDGRGFNHGQAATLIEIEEADDYDRLLQYIIDSDFYGQGYLARQSGQRDDRLIGHFWWVAELVASLSPRFVLEVGCGRGDVLRVLKEAHGVEVAGIDFGSAVPTLLWPSLRGSFHGGDVLELLRDWSGEPYDLACGFDIWEHLLPRRLDETIAELVAHATDDALFVFVIPAFGRDAVFGEEFPLEFDENRAAFEQREPFRYLVTDSADEKVPAAGHLIWAHTDWWVEHFTRHGLVREPDAERWIHRVIDAHVPGSVRAFYVFRQSTPAAQQRVAALGSLAFARAHGARIDRPTRHVRVPVPHATFTTSMRYELRRWFGAHGGPLATLARRARAAAARTRDR